MKIKLEPVDLSRQVIEFKSSGSSAQKCCVLLFEVHHSVLGVSFVIHSAFMGSQQNRSNLFFLFKLSVKVTFDM